jgi:prepilin-type N-terminal cleavage/methylation domain-containing protein
MRIFCLKSNAKSSRCRAGFSLVEMLVVIGVIGVLASIALPVLAGPTKQSADDSRDRRNAQSLAQVYQAGHVAGVDFLVADDLEATVERVRAGGMPNEGSMAGSSYGVPGLTVEAKNGAMRFLELRGEMLLYDFGGR